MMRFSQLPLLGFVALLGFTLPIYAENEAGEDRAFPVALSGYDPVSYFRTNKSELGNSEIAIEYDGVTWYFTSYENQRLFMTSPGDYAPCFLGYDAYAVSERSLLPGNPCIWSMTNGRLCLFHSEGTKRRWLKNTELHYTEALNNWNSLENERRNRYWPKY